MPAVNQPLDPTFQKVQNLIVEVTDGSYEPSDIQPTSDFEENLHIDMELDFPKLVKKVNDAFMIRLDAQRLMDEVQTVEDLVEFIKDETELG